MRTNCYSLTLAGVISIFALLSIILILNSQTVYSKNPEVSFLDVNDTSSVSKFSVAAWFKTSTDYKSDAFIVNKAGASDNMNYGIWMTNTEKIQGGFETSTGKPMYATSPLSYSDGKWHYAVVTFDGSLINLYLDGTQVATESASGSPDNGGDEPVRVGANSGAVNDYFIGDVDEIRVWKSALTPEQVIDAYKGKFNTKNQILYLDFSQAIALLNETSIVNETALNQTALNQTALNQTALNQTALNQTALNQTALNQTGIQVNGTALNQTGIQAVNETANNKTSSHSKLLTRNESGIANETNNNIQRFEKPPILNDTGIINETIMENQTSESQQPKENSPPMASDQSVSVDQNSQIDITMVADDENKNQLQFDITADPLQGTLDNFNKEKGTVTYAPQKDYSGDDKFSFRVIDNKGAGSNEATVDISVNEPSQPNENQETGLPKSVEESSNQTSTEQATTETKSVEEPNQPPKADAGEDQKAAVNSEVKLDGGKSSDEDGKLVSYKWEQTDGPNVDLKNADEKTASLDVPESAADSKLDFKLTVVDDKDASDSDDVTVEVEKSPESEPGSESKSKSESN
jgi:Concanavalin A-like lectin/glucanases superfamily/K319L-like, PKD domain/Bacterial Ig domain